MLGHEKALEEMMKLGPELAGLVFDHMLKAGKVDFVKLSEKYVKWLEWEKREKEGTISTLGLHLGLYSGKDSSPGGKHARKLLFDKGLYTGKDGSAFGQQLEEEFGNQQSQQ